MAILPWNSRIHLRIRSNCATFARERITFFELSATLNLHYVHRSKLNSPGGYSVKEVADTLNISVAAAKATLYQARVRLLQRASVHSGARKRVPARFVDTGAHANLKSREQQWTTCS